MKSLILLIFGLVFSQCSIAQSSTILVFDLVNNTIDSIESVVIDTSIHQNKTKHSLGLFNDNIATLEQDIPTENVYLDAQFTKKIRAADKFDLTDYPIRTSVKIFKVINDSLKNSCSGSMISRRHVLSATHCYSRANTSSIFVNGLYVCPVYNNGIPSNSFHCSEVSKIYLYKDWNLIGEDVAILELEEPIGEATGWIGIGYNDDGSFFAQDIYHKFSYPGVNDFYNSEDSTLYNSDTLYHSYGKLDSSDMDLRAEGATAQRGESGSSIIRIVNNQDYTTYGVLSFIPFTHNRIDNKIFNDIKAIIAQDVEINPDTKSTEYFEIYPNPAASSIFIKKHLSTGLFSIEIFDSRGELVLQRTSSDLISNINISHLANGLYFVRISGIESTEIIKLLKAAK